MLIEIHVIQNHSPANLNRDDLGAPKTCFFGGVLRSRISSQCLKRSIRMSEEFRLLLGARRTRRLAQLVARSGPGTEQFERAMRVLSLCGIAPKESEKDDDKSASLVYVSNKAIEEMAIVLSRNLSDAETAQSFARIIAEHTDEPDMALFGRMLEPKKPKRTRSGDAAEEDGPGKVWRGLDTTVEAALQVAHAISTHEARPEVDYYVAADDVPGADAGAGYVDEALFASACFYKYFSMDWEQLLENLKGNKELAAHTVGAFIRGAALTTPTGKQNSFAAHNPPDGILVEVKDTPISYANAFARPVSGDDVVAASISHLAQFVRDIEVGYGPPRQRFWFSPNGRFPLAVTEEKKTVSLADDTIKSLDSLVTAVVKAVGFDWTAVQRVVVNPDAAR